jgi:hypothetical protein
VKKDGNSFKIKINKFLECEKEVEPLFLLFLIINSRKIYLEFSHKFDFLFFFDFWKKSFWKKLTDFLWFFLCRLKFIYRVIFIFLGAWVDDNGMDQSTNYVKSFCSVGGL